MKAGSWPASGWVANSTWLAFSVNTTGYTPTNFSCYLGVSSNSQSGAVMLAVAPSPAGPFSTVGPLLNQLGDGPTYFNVSLLSVPAIANVANASFRIVVVSASGLIVRGVAGCDGAAVTRQWEHALGVGKRRE